jgi:ankyrin repeat protein
MIALKRILTAIAIGATAVPLAAQSGAYDGEQFVAAIRKGDNDSAMNLLRDKPILVNARDLNGNTALVTAIEKRDLEWTGYLLQQGASPDLPSAKGDSPLIVAARIGFQQAAEWLIGLQAKVDAANRQGETALIVAVQQRRPQIVKLLLEAGADPDKTDSAAGYSARDYARRDSRNPDLLRLIESAKKAN